MLISVQMAVNVAEIALNRAMTAVEANVVFGDRCDILVAWLEDLGHLAVRVSPVNGEHGEHVLISPGSPVPRTLSSDRP